MSERFTSANLKGVFGSGIAERGRLTPEEIIAIAKAHAKYNVDLYSKILETPDEDFYVSTYVGSWVGKKKEILQEGKDFRNEN